ncbi:MAG: bifunctional adenosylcobinamide kinase/adenosylcobinamide-phosphate guanylyltransferase [Paracoccaceae bacterium]
MGLKSLTLVLGGAASGKSAFAEGLIVATGRPRVYVATATAHDAEMTKKIAAHRDQRGPGWETLEGPDKLERNLSGVGAEKVVLLDCATLWLGHAMTEGGVEKPIEAFLGAVAACPAPVVVVSNETGSGVVPATSLGRAFRNAQGALNQAVAARADLAVLVVAGLPVVLKGTLP